MDIFKGIGDFFGGLFGQKKKREDEQQQPQQQQSAVSFNSTPKLGDNFANNANNPAQPQQPKEFAKSSVDLNPVKPVQPVQPQPQVNRDQERQQLANKYRQEEIDRYNQGSDHAANFLNDIFSGGKTAQMRENTINQNIQNRVNAEMLRKYGPDDQQVKQNIAQTSQDINNNATSVNDFTKNYNNTVQQTVASPVSAVKGAANSAVETVPKVSGAVTELGANTIKLFDEDNQFANNLINRVRADREKNIVRKTLNSATGLTDQDNKMAYGLGSSGTRMAIDAAMTPVTGGAVPALVHGVEAHSDMMDSLDNIEARKKAEAAAKGEAYTPSSFGSRYLASTANAGTQAAIEKLGIDNLTGKIGGKFAKNMVGRAVTGALGEAGEEAAQQYAENFTKKLFDNKQNIHEGVAESALMGGIMGGAGKMAFGGMDSVKNPYKSSDMADGEVSISKLHPDQMGYNKDAVLGNTNRNTYYDPKSLYEAERNATIPTREKITLADAERQNRGGDLQYTPKRETNIGRLDGDQLGFTKDELVGKFTGDTRKRMSERSFNMLQDLRTNNPYVTGDGDSVNLSRIGNSKMTHSGATVPNDLFIAKMRTTPRIGEILANAQKTHSAPDVKNHGIAPDGFNYYDSPVRISGKNYIQSFDVGVDKPRNKNTVYNSTIKETPELLSYEAKRNDTESNSDVYNSNIARNDQKVNRMQPFEPIERTPLVNGDRDFGGSFGNGFDPRGENSAVNKAAFPKVQKEDLATPELEKYGIKPTKTEYNQALEYILMEERPELFERYEKARLGLEALEENIDFNQFTPTELEGLYGKNYAEHLDRGMISQMVRKNSLNGLDQAAMGGDIGEIDMEDYIDRLNHYYETKREVKDLEQEIREAYADPELREEAKQALWFNKYEEIENAVANLRQNGVDIDFDGYVELKYGNKAKNEAVKTEEEPSSEDIIAENSKTDKNIVSEAPLIKETGQKTRKFAETVLDTDTPPKDFVKLMHAGDESLKYTPKKNSEMWSRATKSVQESPERVFNELENTRVANDETMAKGIALAKHYQAMGDDLKASELYVELAKKATEAGRTVQALNLMRRTTPEGVLMSTMREVESYNDKMKNKPNKQINITPEQRAEFLGRLREAYAMPEGNLKEIRARRIAIGEAIREVRDQIPSSKWDKFTTLWKAGLLTAPTTHIRNIAGNIINGGSEKTAQTIGSAFDWMISKGTGRRTLTRNGFSGMFKGIKEGSGYAKDIMRTGIDTTGEIDSKWRDQRTNYGNSLGGKLAQGYTDFVFNSLNASDKIFRGSAEKMSIANQAKAIAINERLKGDERKARINQLINNPTNAMLENAKHDADMATFQQDTGLGQFVAKGRQAGGITKKATDIIMPFTGVPSAVADQLVNYSPLGVVKGVKQVADLRKAVKNGLDESTITALQRKASTQLGRGITGTMLLGAGLALANAGALSGQPRDEDEKRQWAAEGKKANALKIGNTWIPIDTLSPQMILAAAGANAESRIKNGQGALEAGLNTLGDGVKSWTEQGYMTGVKDALDTATGDKDLHKYAIQQATSLIPNGIRKTAAAMDDKARQANYGDLGESIQNSIPLWRNGLPAKHDIYGREIKTNPWSTMLDPQKSSTENPTELSQKINEFRKNNPELDSVIPKTAPNKITINGQTRELTSSERSEYQRLLGENISKYMMSGGFNDDSFKKLSEGDKKDMLEKIQSDVKKSVEMALFNKTSKQTNDNAKKIAQNIVNGGNNELNPEWKTKEQSKDELYEKPELEYERLQAEYDKKKKNGDFDGRKVQELQERMKVRKAQVGKDTPKSYRDMYSSGKQSFSMLLKEMDSDQERNEAMTKVLEYGDKLVAAGLEKKNKFRDKYGNVNFDDSSSGKGGGKKGKSAKVSASSVGTADITSTLSKNLLKTRGSQAKALSGMPTISVRNSGLQAKAKRSAVRFKK